MLQLAGHRQLEAAGQQQHLPGALACWYHAINLAGQPARLISALQGPLLPTVGPPSGGLEAVGSTADTAVWHGPGYGGAHAPSPAHCFIECISRLCICDSSVSFYQAQWVSHFSKESQRSQRQPALSAQHAVHSSRSTPAGSRDQATSGPAFPLPCDRRPPKMDSATESIKDFGKNSLR